MRLHELQVDGSFSAGLHDSPLAVVQVVGLETTPTSAGDAAATLWKPVYEFGLIVAPGAEPLVTAGEPTSDEYGSLDELRSRGGNWFGLYSDRSGRLAVFSDCFALRTVFYAFQPGSVLVSSSFQAVSAALGDGESAEISWDTVAPQLLTTTNMFRTRASSLTADRRIRALWPDHVLLITPTGIEVRHQPMQPTPQGHQYEALLDQGINNACDALKGFAATGAPLSLSLSGGKDSRTLLALILASDTARSVEVSTMDARRLAAGASKDIFRRDFELAHKLVERYDLRWADKSELHTEVLGFDGAVHRWQKYRSNQSFEIPTGTAVSGRLDTPTVQLMGIGGELFRSYLGENYRANNPRWAKALESPDIDLEGELRELFSLVCKPWSIPPDHYESIAAEFVRGLLFPEARDGVAALDASYRAYRHPSHSGAFDFNLSANIITYYPLCQQEFVWASQLLSAEDRAGGRVLFDIMDRIAPELLNLEFASPPWPAHFVPSSAANPWEGVDARRQMTLYDENQSHSAHLIPSGASSLSGPDFMLKAGELARDALARAFESSGFPPFLADSAAKERFALVVQAQGPAQLAMLGKALSLLDATGGDGRVVKTVLDFSSGQRQSSWLLAGDRIDRSAAWPAEFEKSFEAVDVSNCRVQLESAGGDRLLVRVEDIPECYEIAVYWFRDSQRVSTDGYARPNASEFVSEREFADPGRYRATVFFKAVRAAEAFCTVNTNELEHKLG